MCAPRGRPRARGVQSSVTTALRHLAVQICWCRDCHTVMGVMAEEPQENSKRSPLLLQLTCRVWTPCSSTENSKGTGCLFVTTLKIMSAASCSAEVGGGVSRLSHLTKRHATTDSRGKKQNELLYPLPRGSSSHAGFACCAPAFTVSVHDLWYRSMKMQGMYPINWRLCVHEDGGEASDVLVHHACIKHGIRFGILESALGAVSMLKYPPADNNSM